MNTFQIILVSVPAFVLLLVYANRKAGEARLLKQQKAEAERTNSR